MKGGRRLAPLVYAMAMYRECSVLIHKHSVPFHFRHNRHKRQLYIIVHMPQVMPSQLTFFMFPDTQRVVSVTSCVVLDVFGGLLRQRTIGCSLLVCDGVLSKELPGQCLEVCRWVPQHLSSQLGVLEVGQCDTHLPQLHVLEGCIVAHLSNGRVLQHILQVTGSPRDIGSLVWCAGH